MKDFLKKNGLLLLVIAVLLSVLLGVASIFLGGRADPVQGLISAVTAPIRGGVSAVLDWAEGVYDYVFRYDELEQEREDLRRQIAQLQEQVRQGTDASRENEQLRALLGLAEKRRDFVFESARVSARTASNWESTLTLTKGSSAGVAVGDCVITEMGALVGVVSQLGSNWCTVSTLISADIEMGGVVARTYSAGILEGDFALMGEGKLKMTYLADETQLVAGDQVLTSGMGEVYPSGLVVGQVEGVFTDPSGMTRYAVVVPDVELDELVEVFVIKEFQIVE